MARRGELYDQDGELPPPDSPWSRRMGPAMASRGILFDQDASMELPVVDADAAERYLRSLEVPRIRISSTPVVTPRPASPPSLRRGGARAAPAPASPSVPAPPSPAAPAAAPAPAVPAPSTAPAGPAAPAPAPAARAPVAAPAAVAAPAGAASGVASRSANAAGAAAPPGRPATTGRATLILAAGTFASRLTGFLRVLVVGYVLGVDVLSDAFNYANGAPNIIYDLLLGGILSATLIPVFVDILRPSADEAGYEDPSRSLSAVMTSISLVLVVVSAMLWLLAPLVIRFYMLLTPATTGPAERSLATGLLRYFAPQVFFLGATVACTALLNARRRFAAAAFSPVLNNLVAIAALLATKVAADHILTNRRLSPSAALTSFDHDGRAVLILGAGTTLGYAIQLLAQLPALHRLGLRLRPVWQPGHPAVRRVAALSAWLIGVVVANQASLALVMVLAGRIRGGVTAYQFGYQFFQLPYALIAVSVASAIMPNLAEYYPRRRVAFERELVAGLRTTLALLLPVAFVYMAVAQPLIGVAIHHGRVTGSGAHLVGTTLVFFAAGLPGFSAFFLLMRGLQAMQDARSMFRIYVWENLMTVVAALVLSPLLGIPGLAIAWAGPYTVASVMAIRRLQRRVGSLGGWLTVRALLRITAAAAVAGAVAAVMAVPFRGRSTEVWDLARLVVQSAAGFGAYLWLARTLGIRELRPVLGRLARLRGAR